MAERWNRHPLHKIARRNFYRDTKCEARVFCGCELCRLRFGRLLYPEAGGEPLGLRRLPGFAGNFSPNWVRARQALADRRWKR
jgi:hypothetical protein